MSIFISGKLYADILEYDYLEDFFREYSNAKLGYAPSISSYYPDDDSRKFFDGDKEIFIKIKKDDKNRDYYGKWFYWENGEIKGEDWRINENEKKILE